jgi:hypothetical protein
MAMSKNMSISLQLELAMAELNDTHTATQRATGQEFHRLLQRLSELDTEVRRLEAALIVENHALRDQIAALKGSK